jgi:ATP synthase protein I
LILVAHDPDAKNPGPVGEDPALSSLESRIEAARKAEDARQAKEHAPMRDGRSAGIEIASTMIGYPLGGIVVGYGLDRLLATTPWITIVLMFLAFAGACLHVIRRYNNRAQ